MHKDINVNVSGPAQPTSTYKTKVLKGNHSFASQVTEPNTKYVIKHDFDLDGAEITIPEGCLLGFDGGSVNNGIIIGDNTGIEAGLVKIFNADITLSGSWNVAEAYPEWFGAKGDYISDDVVALQKCISFCENKQTTLKLSGRYVISDTLHIISVNIDGNRSTIKYTGTDTAINLDNGSHYGLILKNFTLITETGTYGIKGNGGLNHSFIDTVVVSGFSEYGIYFTNSYLCTLTNLRIEHCDIGLYLTEAYCAFLRNIDSVRNNTNIVIGGINITLDTCDVSYAGEVGILLTEMSGCSVKNIYFEGTTNNVSVIKTQSNNAARAVSFEQIYAAGTTATGVKVFDFASDAYNIGHTFNGIKTNVADDTVIFALSPTNIQYPRCYNLTLLNNVVRYNGKGVFYSGNGFVNQIAETSLDGNPLLQYKVVNGVQSLLRTKAVEIRDEADNVQIRYYLKRGDGTTHNIVDVLKTAKGFCNIKSTKGSATYFITGNTSETPTLVTTDNAELFNGVKVKWVSVYSDSWSLQIPQDFLASDYLYVERITNIS